MKLKILDSSTNGTCYMLVSKDECLILEAGVNQDIVYNHAGFDLTKVSGCVVSSSRPECTKFSKMYAEDFNFSGSTETLKDLNLGHFKRAKAVKSDNTYQFSNFLVYPFKLPTNVKTYGYFINHEKTGRFCYVPTCREIPYKFNDMENILIACNYSYDLLRKNVKNDLIKSSLANIIVNTRLELETVLNWLKMQDLSKVKNIVLCNLSKKNSAPEVFKERIMLETKINTQIAVSGLEIDLKP